MAEVARLYDHDGGARVHTNHLAGVLLGAVEAGAHSFSGSRDLHPIGHGAGEKVHAQALRCWAATLHQLGKIEIAQARDLGCERFRVA
jgi:hypothetical protein